MADPIAMPTAVGDRLESYSHQQRELQLAIQVTIDTAAAALGVPSGWQYDHARRAFIPPSAPQNAPNQGGDENGDV